MHIARTASLLAALTLTTALSAQNCTDNQYRIWFVDGNGAPVPTANTVEGPEAVFANESVFLAFDPALPSGSYYVHVTDLIGGADEVRSTNDPNDRVVNVVNTNGVISLTLPFSSNPTPTFGRGLNGQGQSVPLGPFRSTTESPCTFKAWVGDAWDLSLGPSWPYLLRGGYDANLGRCLVRSYDRFRIGDGSGSAIAGTVFVDANQNGARDPGEVGQSGVNVALGGAATLTMPTDANGNYRFAGLGAGNYTITVATTAGYTATTPTSRTVDVCGCGPADGGDFGQYRDVTVCNARTTCFWVSCQGQALIRSNNLLATLPTLGVVDQCGRRVAPATMTAFLQWMNGGAYTCNSAYGLSTEVAAMTFNLALGFVSPDCTICDCRLGALTVRQLVQRAVSSLLANPQPGYCSPARTEQEHLRSALARANANLSWCGTNCGNRTTTCNGGWTPPSWTCHPPRTCVPTYGAGNCPAPRSGPWFAGNCRR